MTNDRRAVELSLDLRYWIGVIALAFIVSIAWRVGGAFYAVLATFVGSFFFGVHIGAKIEQETHHDH